MINNTTSTLYHGMQNALINIRITTIFAHLLLLQVKENLHLGVTYTAILNENTLSNGIFHLLNSSTMLRVSFKIIFTNQKTRYTL